jgi:regulation of enolase protein 1 (concanavalin A-like superfamily)
VGYDAEVVPPTDTRVAWASGTWLNPPPGVVSEGDDLLVTAAEGSDLWRLTSYGFVHDDGHGLLRPLEVGRAFEVSFRVDYDRQFDQAGILVRADERHWLKAGVEVVDGAPQLGAVVTHEASDWSAGPVPDWEGHEVTIRASRDRDAITVRARCETGTWQLVRLAPWTTDLVTTAGPYCCAPTRSGLRVRLTSWRSGPADLRLHE